MGRTRSTLHTRAATVAATAGDRVAAAEAKKRIRLWLETLVLDDPRPSPL
jgi:hypothetical protein